MNQLNWSEIKQALRNTWSNLTNEEIEKTYGQEDHIVQLVKNKYGIAQEQAQSAVSRILQSFPVQQEPSPSKSVSSAAHTIEPDGPTDYPNELYTENLPPETKLI